MELPGLSACSPRHSSPYREQNPGQWLCASEACAAGVAPRNACQRTSDTGAGAEDCIVLFVHASFVGLSSGAASDKQEVSPEALREAGAT